MKMLLQFSLLLVLLQYPLLLSQLMVSFEEDEEEGEERMK